MKFLVVILVSVILGLLYSLARILIRFVRRIRLVRHYKKKVNELLDQMKGEKDDSAVS